MANATTASTIPLPAGKYSAVKLLASGVNGSQAAQTFTLTYSDGTSASVTQSLSDWCAPQSFAGESEAVIMTYRDNSDGSRDTRPVMLYLYSFPVASGKTVSSITLPKNRNVVALAATMAP